MADLTPLKTSTGRKKLTASVLLASALLFSACGSGSEDAAPASIPFDDTSEPAEPVSTSEAAPIATTSTTSTTSIPETATTPEPTTPPAITFGTDETAGVLQVRNVSADDVLNIRSGPGVDNDIIGTLSPEAWHVQPTSNIATVDGVLWREVDKGDGTVGFVHANYVTYSQTTCDDSFVVDASIANVQVAGDLDGDNLSDAIELIVGNSDVHLEVAFGSGATLRRYLGPTSDQALLGLEAYEMSVVDLDGNDRDELRIDTHQGRWTGTTFYRALSSCEILAYGNTGSVFELGTYGSAGSPMFWGCKNIGTSDVQIVTTVGLQSSGEMTFTVTTWGFDIDDGFINVADAPQYTMTPEEFEAANAQAGSCAN